jgi:hypothetical protein
MGLFSRSKEPPIEEISAVLDVREAPPRPLEQVAEFPPPPRALTKDLPMHVPWTFDAPARPGLYWWRRSAEPHLAVVIEFGGRMVVRTRRGDSSLFVGVAALERQWAGPLALADGIHLEDLEVSQTRI